MTVARPVDHPFDDRDLLTLFPSSKYYCTNSLLNTKSPMVASRLAASRSTFWICPTCARQQKNLRRLQSAPTVSSFIQKRSISKQYIARTEAAEKQWEEQHKEIKAGERQGMLSILQERGYVNSVAGFESF